MKRPSPDTASSLGGLFMKLSDDTRRNASPGSRGSKVNTAQRGLAEPARVTTDTTTPVRPSRLTTGLGANGWVTMARWAPVARSFRMARLHTDAAGGAGHAVSAPHTTKRPSPDSDGGPLAAGVGPGAPVGPVVVASDTRNVVPGSSPSPSAGRSNATTEPATTATAAARVVRRFTPTGG